jgi:hypothetical protein
MIFTAWGKDLEVHALIMGEGPPSFVDGTPLPDCPDLVFRIEAPDWEDAVTKYREVRGEVRSGGA